MGEWSEFQENRKRALDNEPRNISIWFSCCYLVAFRLLRIHFGKTVCCRSGVEKSEGQYYGNEQTVYAAGAKFPLFICESLTKANRAVLSRSLNVHARMCAKLLQLCLTFCDPTDCSPPGFSVHGVL